MRSQIESFARNIPRPLRVFGVKWSDLETLPSMVAMGAAYLLLEMLAPSPRVRPATESVIERTSFGIGRAVSQAGGTREDAGFRGLANRW